ncbi:MAG: methionine--tRNA ligase [Candidatus Omnitrophota bacterium]|jgi:methionyl-tRNA synthetase
MNKFYLTTPVYYVNSKPHIGHSYTQIACDCVARFMRSCGYDTLFMTGTDEHGEKIEKTTIEKGYKPGEEKRFVDEIVPAFKDLWTKLDIKYDFFIRTTDDYHEATVKAVLDKLYKSGKIYKKEYQGWFCTPCETFWSDTQSADGTCPECKRPLEKLNETNYFLKISECQEWLINYINANPDFIRPDFRRNEVLGFLNNEPLTDLCISRPKKRLQWGIELPFDKDFVTYVWFDALLNYISGVGYGRDTERFNRYWPCDFHVIGKDILRHHAVYWPIILHMAEIAPPKAVFAHGWWVIKGEKMSKSKGNAVDPFDMINRYGIDPYRYFLLREIAFGLDGSFSEESLISRYNSDLANDLGNLLNRTLTMAEKYFEGKVPDAGELAPEARNEALKAKAQGLASLLESSIPMFDFTSALSGIWEVIGMANKYIEDSKPWTLAKENKTPELARVIYTLLEVIRITAVSIYSFMPRTSLSIYKQLGLAEDPEDLKYRDAALWGKLEKGTKVAKDKPLFPRIESA